MKIGINSFLFTSPFTNESVSWFPKFKSWGFDSVEIAIEDPSHIDPLFIKNELNKYGLVCGSVCAAMGPDRDLRGTSIQQNTSLKYLITLLEQMVILKCPILVGPIYSSVGRADAVEPNDYETQWQTVKKHLQTLAQYAEKKGLKLGLEPLNRFETDFINTTEQGLKMIDEVNNPALGLHLDTFHMNIEEKSQKEAILKASKKLFHFHACGTDRGTPGKDSLDWKPIFDALKQIDYQGDLVIESFTQDVKVIAKAAAIWRKIELSQEDIAVNGIKFLKSQLINY
ncbi:MAG: sugar phosphate isomerase/epimerase family protein [Bacteroidota bacterium]|nr:sugar phosphate isomerase/epimerase family protein [Bacteroidota bacterium]